MTTPLVTSELIGAERAEQRAMALYAAMSLRHKRRYNYYLALEAGKLARAHTKAQQDLDGRPFAKRAMKPAKKVLTRLAQRKRLLITSDADAGTVTWRKALAGIVARVHQEGHSGKARALKRAEMRALQLPGNLPAGSAPASKGQLRSLRRLKVDVNAPKLRNLTWLRAGVIIKYLRRRQAGTLKAPRQTQWQVPVPARSFLGASPAERRDLASRVFKKILSDVDQGRV